MHLAATQSAPGTVAPELFPTAVGAYDHFADLEVDGESDAIADTPGPDISSPAAQHRADHTENRRAAGNT
ncbi:hypothetical protein ACQPZ2_31465 [Nocardia pseudovaccinii]|uniref:hypothetical protein n=1 Tax=Nocardia pseudovaccinii TaxID=189540 RepID=UPI003D8E15D7